MSPRKVLWDLMCPWKVLEEYAGLPRRFWGDLRTPTKMLWDLRSPRNLLPPLQPPLNPLIFIRGEGAEP